MQPETVHLIHMYRDGIHDKVDPDRRIGMVGIPDIAASLGDALHYLTDVKMGEIVSQQFDGKYYLVGILRDGQFATYAIEEFPVYHAFQESPHADAT